VEDTLQDAQPSLLPCPRRKAVERLCIMSYKMMVHVILSYATPAPGPRGPSLWLVSCLSVCLHSLPCWTGLDNECLQTLEGASRCVLLFSCGPHSIASFTTGAVIGCGKPAWPGNEAVRAAVMPTIKSSFI